MKKTVILVALATMCLGVNAGEFENTSPQSRESVDVSAAAPASGQVLEVPEMLPYTDLSVDGFTANWTEVDGADGYVFHSYLFHTASQEEEFKLLDTSFKKFDAGYDLTPDSPLNYKQVGSSISLNYIVERSEWTCAMPALANGCLGLDNARSYNDEYGEITSPVYNLAVTDGAVHVMIRCYGDGVTKLTAMLVGVETTDNVTLETELDSVTIDITDTWDYHALTLTGATDSTKIKLRAADGSGRLWINELEVSVRLAEGSTIQVPYVSVSGDEIVGCSTMVATPDRTIDDTYACEVAAYVGRLTGVSANAVLSDYSSLTFVPNESVVDYDEENEIDGQTAAATSVEVCNDARVVGTADGVRIVVSSPMPVTVYNLGGQVVYSSGTAETHDVALTKGLYVARVGSSTLKIAK